MSKIKIGINGMGRIGRTVLRELYVQENASIEVVAVNNPGERKRYHHLIQFDSVHGRLNQHFEVTDKGFQIGNATEVAFHTERDPSQIPWSDHGVQIVIDATGIFKDQEGLGKHLGGSVKKVIMCAPGKDLDATFVMGINHKDYLPEEHHIVSNASCTTNCLAPVCKVLHEKFGLESGFMTTVHAYTSDQQLLDGAHSDPRRARAAGLSMIPTTTGAAKTVGVVIPELKGKLDGYAVRVPTPNVSMVDLTATLKVVASADEVNQAMQEAAQGELKGILSTEEIPLVSTDYNGLRESSCVDLTLTNTIGNNLKIVAWYDNEVGFSNRVIDLASMMAGKL